MYRAPVCAGWRRRRCIEVGRGVEMVCASSEVGLRVLDLPPGDPGAEDSVVYHLIVLRVSDTVRGPCGSLCIYATPARGPVPFTLKAFISQINCHQSSFTRGQLDGAFSGEATVGVWSV